MSITNELRELASAEVPYKYGHQLTAIAERIDEQHERECTEWLIRGHNGWATVGNKDVMAGWVRLPVDADGEVIRIGDELVLQHEVAETPSVVQSITWDGEDWYFTCDEGFFNACGWSHHHEPTVEDVLRDMAVDWDCAADGEDKAEVLKEYAAKLRLADGGEVQQ